MSPFFLDLDPCNAAKNCSYACKIKDGNPECYCDSNSRLNPQDNETCVGRSPDFYHCE